MTPPLLQVTDFSLAYRVAGKLQPALQHITLQLAAGECYGLVGESGSGKSTLGLAALGYLAHNAHVTSGQIIWQGKSLLDEPLGQRRLRWGRELSYMPQDPLAALNPSFRIGFQIAEVLQQHLKLSAAAAHAQAIDWLASMQLPSPAELAQRYPHQLSGGQQQRVLLAMALCAQPQLLVLDEPTTGLDVTTEAAVLALVQTQLRQQNTAALFVTHNLGLVARLCERVGVLQKGILVESGTTAAVFQQPQHPYTRHLLTAVPQLGRQPNRPAATGEPMSELLKVQDLSVVYGKGQQQLQAVRQVSLTLPKGRILGLVGESGSGKSSLVRAILGLVDWQAGYVTLSQRPLPERLAQRGRQVLRQVQMVFQNPQESLNPYQTVAQAIARPLQRLLGQSATAAQAEVQRLLTAVRLPTEYAQRYPDQLSGGERQRVAIARAIASQPNLLLLDEPVSALDVSVQATILDLLRQLQVAQDIGMLLISHDLAVVANLADLVAVLYLGQLLEVTPTSQLLQPPHHPYTAALLAAVPRLDANQSAPELLLPGEIPNPRQTITGCPFHTRCPVVRPVCHNTPPPWQVTPAGKHLYCHINWTELN